MLGRGQLSEIGLYTRNILVNELSSNIIDFCPVGALTNKNFALNYRSWDSYYVDSIDIMDTFLNSVRVYTDNLKIKRILSNYNTNLDLYWISDKSRYFFDSLKVQRLSYPLILKKSVLFNVNNINTNNYYVTSSWKNISNYLKDFLIVNKKVSIKSVLGDFIDLETINNFKYFTFSLGSNLLVNNTENSNIEILNNNLNFDIEANYINNSMIGLNNYDLYIFYNYNLRIENPVFNSKLRQKVVWFNFTNLFFFGTNYNLTYKYYHLSNSNDDFLKFIFGRHWLCNLIFKFKNICFTYGNNIFYDSFIKKSWLFYFNKLNKLKLKLFNSKKINFDIIYLSSSLTTLASFDLMFFSKFNSYELNLEKNIYYYLGLNQVIFNKNKILSTFNFFKNNFYIYQNSFFDNTFKFCNIMLPVYNCFEVENQYFMNTMGLIKQNSKLELNLEEFLKSNLEVLNFIFKLIKLNFIDNFNKLLINNIPYNCFFKNRKFINLNKLIIFDLNFSIKYKNFYLISLNKNFYKSNIYCFYSKQLNMMGNLFFKNKSNFEL